MKLYATILGSALFLCGVAAKTTHRGREARWFGDTYTETKIQKETVTALVPSSCVHVEPTLPPCRSVRNLQAFPDFVGPQIHHPHDPRGRDLAEGKQNASHYVGWAEYLGLVGPTVTVTALHLQTTTVLDPRTVVTFSVKGCRPSKLPMDLDRCPTSQYLVEEIIPTAAQAQILPTAVGNELNGGDGAKRGKSVRVESSAPDLDFRDFSNVETAALSDVQLSKRK